MITPHQGMSYPTCMYSLKYCNLPVGHQLARPRVSSGGSPTHCMTESVDSGSGVGFSGKKSRTISSVDVVSPEMNRLTSIQNFQLTMRRRAYQIFHGPCNNLILKAINIDQLRFINTVWFWQIGNFLHHNHPWQMHASSAYHVNEPLLVAVTTSFVFSETSVATVAIVELSSMIAWLFLEDVEKQRKAKALLIWRCCRNFWLRAKGFAIKICGVVLCRYLDLVCSSFAFTQTAWLETER